MWSNQNIDAYYGFVYMTKNNVTGKSYIGKHKREMNPDDIDDSWYLGSGVLLQKAINKYGADSFTRTILCECSNAEALNKAEVMFINYYHAVDRDEFYNLALGGDGLSIVPECVREKMRHPHKPMSDDARQNMSRTFSAETKQKFANNAKEKLTGLKHSDQSKANMRAGHLGSKSIFKDGVYRYIKNYELEKYLSEGWILRGATYGSKIARNDKGLKTWIRNGIEERVVYKDTLNSYTDNGWVKGRLKGSERYRA